MKEFKFTFTNGTTRVVHELDYARALIRVYNPQTKIISFTETPCVYRYDITITNVYIPQEVGEFTYTKHHELYSTKLLAKDELDSYVNDLDLDIEAERFVDEYEIVDYEHNVVFIGERL